jgi:hypothetical protein
MTDYRSTLRAHEIEPMVDWRMSLGLAILLSLGFCAGLVVLLSV